MILIVTAIVMVVQSQLTTLPTEEAVSTKCGPMVADGRAQHSRKQSHNTRMTYNPTMPTPITPHSQPSAQAWADLPSNPTPPHPSPAR